MPPPAAYDLSPVAAILLVGATLALLPLAWVWRRHGAADASTRRRALTVLTLLLTFDLVLFGAFTRLTDSGLGCPDWPGCYGSASPVGAQRAIAVAQAALPSGPVTHGKAWVEMVHRYLATGVGALIAAIAWLRWRAARADPAAAAASRWAVATLLWVCLQGAFGALTVTMKLYPAIVTAHLLGGIVLLVLLAVQSRWERRASLAMPRPLVAAAVGVAVLVAVQIALGGWVSTNYAVLACRDFPTCQGSWWPAMDFAHGFELLRGLGRRADGTALPFAALTAIHYVHRLGAYLVLAAMTLFGAALVAGGAARLRRFGAGVLALAAWQLASGLGNVVLGWPLAGAVAHTAGAAATMTLLAMLLTQARPVASGVGAVEKASSAAAGSTRPARAAP